MNQNFTVWVLGCRTPPEVMHEKATPATKNLPYTDPEFVDTDELHAACLRALDQLYTASEDRRQGKDFLAIVRTGSALLSLREAMNSDTRKQDR